MTVLVIGGAGYIGAHVVRLLSDQGKEALVVDDLSSGQASRVDETELVQLDVVDPLNIPRLEEVMRSGDVSSVIHFAARKQVGESVARPAWYYQQNIGGLANVLTAMENAHVDTMIFSSSAAVYGTPPVSVVDEKTQPSPINPYGETKLVGEWLLADCEKAWDLKWAGLRYFNVAGAGWDDLGDPAVMNLIPMVLEKLTSGQAPRIFGDDYDTPDGTCIRDYIHVKDLAEAHIAALDFLAISEGHTDRVFNVGTGRGNSVREVIDVLRQTTSLDIEPETLERRPGDPAQLVGDARRIRAAMDWEPKYGLEEIAASAWRAWQRQLHG